MQLAPSKLQCTGAVAGPLPVTRNADDRQLVGAGLRAVYSEPAVPAVARPAAERAGAIGAVDATGLARLPRRLRCGAAVAVGIRLPGHAHHVLDLSTGQVKGQPPGARHLVPGHRDGGAEAMVTLPQHGELEDEPVRRRAPAVHFCLGRAARLFRLPAADLHAGRDHGQVAAGRAGLLPAPGRLAERDAGLAVGEPQHRVRRVDPQARGDHEPGRSREPGRHEQAAGRAAEQALRAQPRPLGSRWRGEAGPGRPGGAPEPRGSRWRRRGAGSWRGTARR